MYSRSIGKPCSGVSTFKEIKSYLIHRIAIIIYLIICDSYLIHV